MPFNRIKQKWGKQYPQVIVSWRKNWENLTMMFNVSALGLQVYEILLKTELFMKILMYKMYKIKTKH